LLETEREHLQVFQTESSPEPESEPLTPQSAVPKRTPLPNSPVKHSPPSSAPTTPNSTKHLRVAKSGAKWSDQEDALLKRSKNRGLSWQDVSRQLPGRSANACNRRYHRSLAIPPTASKSLSTLTTTSTRVSNPTTVLRRGKWSPEEVAKLRRLRDAGVEWDGVSKQLPGRTPAACRRKSDALRKIQSFEKYVSNIEQNSTGGNVEGEDSENSRDGEMSGCDIVEEKSKRDIEEGTYSTSDDEDMSGSDIGDQEPESKAEEKEPNSVVEDEKAESSISEDISESTSEEDPSESENEDEAEKKRKHATFFLKR